MKIRLSLFALVALMAVTVSAQIVDPALKGGIDALSTERVRAVVTFDHAPTATDRTLIASIAPRFQFMRVLPMALVETTPAALRQLIGVPGVKSLYSDAALQYYLHESVPLIGAPGAWRDFGADGKGIGVAVIDTGVDATHPDLPLGTKVVQNVKIVGASEEDTGVQAINVVIEDVPNSDTSSGHGTHCAGTVGGLGNASKTNTADDIGGYGYYTGVAPGAHIVGVGAGDGLHVFFALEGFDYVVARRNDYNIKVVSNSWGSTMAPGEAFDPAHPINEASKIAHDAGMTVVFAAGNSGPGTDTLNRYSVAPWVIGVANGLNDGKTIANSSSRGRYEDDFYRPTITAPGTAIVSTRANNTILPPIGLIDGDTEIRAEWLPYYTTMSGTSMATPHVAGVVAMLYSARPDMTPALAKRIIVNTATPMPDYKAYAAGAGYVNAYAAVQQAKAIKNVKAYRDPRTGKTIDVYVVEQRFEDTVGPAVASYNAILATNTHPFPVATGAVFLDTKLIWNTYLSDIDLYLSSQDAVTGTWAAEANSQKINAYEMDSVEGIALDYPKIGNWKADVRGWLNAPQAYTLVVQQYFPLTK